ncbi:MAG: hypothetical protein ABIY50_04675 [Ignavibacteria bacterium]
MRLQSSDTNPKAETLLIEMIRELNTSQRISKALSLSSSIINLSKRAIERANPNKDKSELDLLFVKLHYGNELADKLKLFLQNTHKLKCKGK